MIHGANTVLTPTQVLESSQFLFYLTGSRFFETATEKSDYDFFVQDTIGLETFFKDNGFKLDGMAYLGDPTLVKIFKLDNVHVQIVKDAALKLKVQKKLRRLMRSLQPDKALAKIIWSTAFDLAN